MSPGLADLLTALERALAGASAQEIPPLLGELERLKAALWARMMNPHVDRDGQPETPAEDLQLLSVPQVAALLDLPKGRVYELIRQGEIPAVPVGKKNVRVPRAASGNGSPGIRRTPGWTGRITPCIVAPRRDHAVTGSQCRRLRRRLGLTQRALASLLAVTANTVARWERGEVPIREPMARLVRLLAKTKLAARRRRRN